MLKCQKHLFSIPEGAAYLNGAYMSPITQSVTQAGIMGIMRKADPTQVKPKDFFKDSHRLRQAFGRLVNTPDVNRVVIIPSVSYGIATVARNVPLQAGEEILLAGEQFPSNYYSWERLAQEKGAFVKIINAPDAPLRGQQWNEQLLDAISEKTRLVALGHVHWTDGTLFHLKQLRSRSREVGALMVIDGTQSVGALPFDISELQPDALICGGYKWLMGPYSIGLAYYGEAFDQGIPLEENWINRLGSEDFTGLVHYESSYQPDSLRYGVGEHSNFILVPMLLESIRQLNNWGVENIQAYCESLVKAPLAELRDRGYLIEEEGYRAHHLFGIRLPAGIDAPVIQKKLEEDNIHASLRGDALRISVSVYNDEEDVQRLMKALER